MGRVLPAVILPVVFLLSFFIGRFEIDWSKAFDASTVHYRVFVHLRMGRTLMVLFAGLGLGMAGNTFQSVFRNPLASPDVAGVASGASVGAATAIVFGNSLAAVLPGFAKSAMIPVFAMAGGILALVMVMLLTKASGRTTTVSLLLSGIIINAVFQALLMFIKLSADTENTLQAVEFWIMGSFSDVTLDGFLKVIAWIAVGVAGMLMMSRQIRLLNLPDDEAQMLGISVKRCRMLALGFSTLTTAAVISTTGIIAFIGLLAPHIARKLDIRGGQLLSGIVGAVLLLVADILVRLISKAELPISVVTSLVGAPILFLLVCRRNEVNH